MNAKLKFNFPVKNIKNTQYASSQMYDVRMCTVSKFQAISFNNERLQIIFGGQSYRKL